MDSRHYFSMATVRDLANNNSLVDVQKKIQFSYSDKNYNSTLDDDTLTSLSALQVVYPRGITIFAAVCCTIFIIVGLTGMCNLTFNIVLNFELPVWFISRQPVRIS